MKQLARKKTTLSLVGVAFDRAEASPDVTSSKLEEFFGGWLERVKPDALAESRLNVRTTSTPLERRLSLTAIEYNAVNRATVRESDTHRVWPLEVIEKFLTADIVKRK